MTPEALLGRLQALGVVVELTGQPEHPIVLHPVQRIPPELRPEVVAHRGELLALVERREHTWQADPPELAPWHTISGQAPRPDLPGSELWVLLLRLAGGDADDPRGTYGRLLAARACGAILEWRGRSWRLRPTFDPTERLSVWATEADWDSDVERWLRPRAKEILTLLRQLPPPGALGGG